jgi:hypothetical protein
MHRLCDTPKAVAIDKDVESNAMISSERKQAQGPEGILEELNKNTEPDVTKEETANIQVQHNT